MGIVTADIALVTAHLARSESEHPSQGIFHVLVFRATVASAGRPAQLSTICIQTGLPAPGVRIVCQPVAPTGQAPFISVQWPSAS